MAQKDITSEQKGNSTWDHLEGFVRDHVRRFIPALLEEVVTELLGWAKSARCEAVEAL